jgi:hypothetical protein
MNRGTRRGGKGWLWCAAVGLVGLSGAGCQTHIGGMTLPSAYYLKDRPDYLPPMPQFPLPNERASMLASAAAVGQVPLPPNVRAAGPAAGGPVVGGAAGMGGAGLGVPGAPTGGQPPIPGGVGPGGGVGPAPNVPGIVPNPR